MIANFKQIPETTLEVAVTGVKNNRIIFIRKVGACNPISVTDNSRVVMIGSPQREIRDAMRNGRLSRPVLNNEFGGISGHSYQALRKHLDDYLG